MIRILTTLFFPMLRSIKPALTTKRELTDNKSNACQSPEDNPQFLVKSPKFYLLTGWVTVSVKMESNESLNPKLYLDYGEGYSQARAITLYQTGLDVYRAELVLSSHLKAMRFDPSDIPCQFSINTFEITAHSDVLHILNEFVSIIKDDFQSKGDTLRIVKKSYARYKKHGVNGMLERLDREYNLLHPNRIQRVTPPHIEYMNWIHKNEHSIYDSFKSPDYPYQPLLSVVMPTYNTSPKFLKKAIDSVINQSYGNWELCIADDDSTDEDTLHLLREYREKYDNIFVYFRSHNGHISKATNTALGLAKGEFVAFLDHDDMLAPHALAEVVKVLNANKDLKLIYSDEDKIDEEENRYDPHFKSGWNPDMFFSQNYISHLTVLKKEVLDRIKGLRVGYEGAQDYDLLLRSLSEIKESEIAHIEQILYHWRAILGSTALDASQKEYTAQAGLKALSDFFSNKDTDIEVHEGLAPGTYKVSYPLPLKQPLVTLLIPTRDGYDILSKCVESILAKTTYENYEIIILDNQTSDPETLEYFELLTAEHNNIRILEYDQPFNYSAINNFGVKHAQGEIIGLINNDVEVISDHWLSEMVQHALRPEIGAVGAMLYYDNDTIQHAGVILIGGVAGHSHKYFKRGSSGYFYRLKIVQNYSAVTAACLLVRRELYLEVGGLEEEHLKVAFNDVDFCLKLGEKGYRNLWTPYVELYHHESISRGSEDTAEKMARAEKEVSYMQKRWSEQIKADLYYNSNLTKKHENFSLFKK